MKRYFFYLIVCFIVAIFNMGCSNDIELDLYCTINGNVIDAQTGEPIKAASVMLTPSGKTTVSGSDGTFEFASIDPGQYTILVQALGYVSNRKIINTVAGETHHVDIPMSK